MTKLLGVLLLCATSCFASFEDKWMGKTTAEIISEFGLPQAKMEDKDGNIWQYVQCIGGNTTLPAYGTYVRIPPYCARLMFTFVDGVVTKAEKKRQ